MHSDGGAQRSIDKHRAAFAARQLRSGSSAPRSIRQQSPTPSEPLTRAEDLRAEMVIQGAVDRVMLRLRNDHRITPTVAALVAKAIASKCASIEKVARMKPAEFSAKSRLDEKRKEARTELAGELRAARSRLRALNRKLLFTETEATKVMEARLKEKRKEYADRLRLSKNSLHKLRASIRELSEAASAAAIATYGSEYPAIPAPAITPTRAALGLPDSPGIYFLWNGDCIEYIGMARRLCSRLALGGHHILREHHRISYIHCEERMLTWTECYYIGFARPIKNFGASATHYEVRSA